MMFRSSLCVALVLVVIVGETYGWEVTMFRPRVPIVPYDTLQFTQNSPEAHFRYDIDDRGVYTAKVSGIYNLYFSCQVPSSFVLISRRHGILCPGGSSYHFTHNGGFVCNVPQIRGNPGDKVYVVYTANTTITPNVPGYGDCPFIVNHIRDAN